MENKENKIHLIGNAHLDPVFLWALPDGLSEIKATFRSALDRIKEFDGFIFTTACMAYYAWVEENCPEMFEEIKQAVRDGRWCITGAMWVQPDCNLISAESFARHLLYSQKFVRDRFGITVKTGYNVDSFGHTASLPMLLREGGVENYVYMRPNDEGEKEYPFKGNLFEWQYGKNNVTAFRIIESYGYNFKDDSVLKDFDKKASNYPYDLMMFYGVSNHGGGPTIRNINEIRKYQKNSDHTFIFSSPDKYFKDIKQNKTELPVYCGDLQNHASGCYSANSYVKAANCFAEDRLAEAEKWLVMANKLLGRENKSDYTEEAWKGVLFNQFHDLLCGCSIKSSFDDAKGDFEFARSVSFKLKSRALQAISWAVDTERGVTTLSKDSDWLWELEDKGTPVVVFNPLSYDVTVPVMVRKPRYCAGITYFENGKEIPLNFQKVRIDVTEHDYKHGFLINAPVPAFGYRTFWVYATAEHSAKSEKIMYADEYTLQNGTLRVEFDKETGNISSVKDLRNGAECVGKYAGRPVIIDDSPNDTWAHGNFVFDKIENDFGSPEFRLLESGDCIVSLCVKQYCGANYIEQTYSLYPNEAQIHVSVRVFMHDELKMVKLLFSPTNKIKSAVYGCAGGVIEKTADGREQPMQRFVATTDGKTGLAAMPNGKYSASANDEYFAFVAVRTCYYADHVGERDGRLVPQDIGLNEFEYTITPFYGDLAELEKSSELLHAEFPAINETYHKGILPQQLSLLSVSNPSISVKTIKAAENNDGLIFRLQETSGKDSDGIIKWIGEEYPVSVSASEVATYRLGEKGFIGTNFLED